MNRICPVLCVVFIFATMSLGCQSEQAALELICDAPNQIDEPNAEPPEKQAAISLYIASNLSNEAVIADFQKMETMTPDERDEVIEEFGARSGLEECALVEFNREMGEWMEEQREGE